MAEAVLEVAVVVVEGALVKQDVFVSDENNNYRIPTIISNKKRILAFCERRTSKKCDKGVIDIVLRIRENNVWSDLIKIVGDGKNTFRNPCPVLFKKNFYLFFCKNKKQVFFTKSKNGMDWSKPIKIKTLPECEWFWTGPGHGIVFDDKIVIPCHFREKGFFKKSRATILFGVDTSWRLGDVLKMRSDESCVVEVNGELYLNSRCSSNHLSFKRKRVFAFGNCKTWRREGYSNLRDPVCQGSLINFKDSFLFCNPNSFFRRNLTIHKSSDCVSWRVLKVLNKGWSGYSDMAVSGDTVFCLFENGVNDYREKISLTNFELQ